MTWFGYLNIALWTIDTIAIGSLIAIYFWFTKTYQNWNVWQINSGNDVIDSTTLNKVVHEFKTVFNLKKYQVVFNDDEAHKIFWNLKKRKKQILISKRIFISVGYELDYLISRIWLSAKEIQKNWLVRGYKVLVKYLPLTLIILSFISYIFNTIIFILGLSFLDNLNSIFLEFLWTKPILALLVIIFFGLLGINFYSAAKIKEKIELLYNHEVLKVAKNILDTYFFDFTAARQYAQQIHLPFLLIFDNKHEKWLGPFTY